MNVALLVGASFLASAVEMVEALTIVLAVGLTQGWRSALSGVALALLALAAIVAALGPSLVNYVPLEVLQVIIGVLLLVFGLQWLRKAILRASGLKALHNEEQIFERELEELRRLPAAAGAIDWTGFVLSFKGVFLEGLEVAFIVLTFGANSGRWGPAAGGAFLAFVIVAAVGAFVHRPLSRVPENHIKFAVGILLTAFGTFWGGEGVGIEWALGDVMIPVLAALYVGVAAVSVMLLQRTAVAAPLLVAEGGE